MSSVVAKESCSNPGLPAECVPSGAVVRFWYRTGKRMEWVLAVVLWVRDLEQLPLATRDIMDLDYVERSRYLVYGFDLAREEQRGFYHERMERVSLVDLSSSLAGAKALAKLEADAPRDDSDYIPELIDEPAEDAAEEERTASSYKTPAGPLFDVGIITVGDDAPLVAQEEMPLAEAIEFARTFNRMQYLGRDHEDRAIVVCREPEPLIDQGCKWIDHKYNADGTDDAEETPKHVIFYDADEIPCAVVSVPEWEAEDMVESYNRLSIASEGKYAHLAVIHDGPAPTLEDAKQSYEDADYAGENHWEVIRETDAEGDTVLRNQVSKHVAEGYAKAFTAHEPSGSPALIVVRKMAKARQAEQEVASVS